MGNPHHWSKGGRGRTKLIHAKVASEQMEQSQLATRLRQTEQDRRRLPP